MSRYVKIYYGPYEAFYTTSHKPQKLKGLRDQLLRLGFRVDMIPVEYINYCVLEMGGHEIFRCNIKNLQFNIPHEIDSVCQRAVDYVSMNSEKIHRARNYHWLHYMLSTEMFSRSEYDPKDYWSQELNLKSFATCSECIECCDIVVQKIMNKLTT